MDRRRGQRWVWLLAGMVLSGAGCSRGDRDRLIRVAHKITTKAVLLSADTNDRLQTGFQGFPANLDLSGLDARVSNRLHWDKELAEMPIQVEAAGSVVTLKGPVTDLSQRQRAVGLALSTVGVTRVIDDLQMPEPGP